MKVEKLLILNLRVSAKDRKRLLALAKKHAAGNLSAWLRHAGLKYIPQKTKVFSKEYILTGIDKVKKQKLKKKK